MKFYLLSDNTDTQMGMRLVGIDGVVIHTRDEVLEELEKVVEDEEIAIVLITTKLIELCPNVISEFKLKQKQPLIVEIPDRHGSANVGETLDQYISEAIGVDLEG